MELVHDFAVPVPREQAWTILLDVERVAACMPGASVTRVDGDSFEGVMKLRVGPIGMSLAGQGRFVEKDEQAHRITLQAQGDDPRGGTAAAATVSAELTGDGTATNVHVVTELSVSGRAAQFGGSVIKEVSNKLLGEFVSNLGAQLQGEPGGSGPAAAVGGPSGRLASGSNQQVSEMNVLSMIPGGESLQRGWKPAAIAAVAFTLGYFIGAKRILERYQKNG